MAILRHVPESIRIAFIHLHVCGGQNTDPLSAFVQLDPIPTESHRPRATSLIPVARRAPNPDSETEDPNASEAEIATPTGTPENKERAEYANSQKSPPNGTGMKEERAPLLGLPAPSDNMNVWTRVVGLRTDIMGIQVPAIVWIRTVKSCILVAKASVHTCFSFT